MRALAISISMIIAIAIAFYISISVGFFIALACVLYQVVLSYGRSATGSMRSTMTRAILRDTVRNGAFLIPLIDAVLIGSWPAALATIVAFGVNLTMS